MIERIAGGHHTARRVVSDLTSQFLCRIINVRDIPARDAGDVAAPGEGRGIRSVVLRRAGGLPINAGLVVVVSDFALPRRVRDMNPHRQADDATIEILLAQVVIRVSVSDHGRAVSGILLHQIRQAVLFVKRVVGILVTDRRLPVIVLRIINIRLYYARIEEITDVWVLLCPRGRSPFLPDAAAPYLALRRQTALPAA